MKKKYTITIIVLLLICTAVIITKIVIDALPTPEQIEYEAYMREMSRQSSAVRAQFDDTVTYCKEQEEALMKVSEVFLEQYHENITSQETAEIAQNNTSPEWTQLSEKLTLQYPVNNKETIGKSVYYFCDAGGGSALYIVYINAGGENIYDFGIGGYLGSKKEKINENLYVCFFYDPMLGL